MKAHLTGREGKLRQHTVGIRELGNVLTAIPRKLNGLCAAGAHMVKVRIALAHNRFPNK